VLQYNSAEAKFAQRDPAEVIGKNFFSAVAPCTHVRNFYGSFLNATSDGEFDRTFQFAFRFPFGLREARIRLFSDGTPGGIYVFVEPTLDGNPVAIAAA
jgi:hypothetical protein